MLVRDLVAHSEWFPPDYERASRPTVSIFLPTYRRFKCGSFQRCVESLLAQSFDKFELLIIDDASTDGTSDLIRGFMANDPRVGCIRHPRNIGLPAVSEFEALQKSRGNYLFFAFDDNVFYPDALEKLLDALLNNDKYIIHGHVDWVFPNKNGPGETVVSKFGYASDNSAALYSHNFIPNNAVLARREVFDRVGWYDPHIVITRLCDWDLWRRVIAFYDMKSVDVAVGKELGPTLDDSIGNTHKMNIWAIEEWMRQPGRDASLSISRFLDYDVVACPEAGSSLLKTIICETEALFRDKWWASSGIRAANRFGTILVVVAREIDASTSLSFFGLGEMDSHIRVISCEGWSIDEVQGAQAVIFVRSIVEDWVRHCELLGVPHYYFVDDNLCTVTGEVDTSSAWRDLDHLRRALKGFDGILLSSPALVEWFRANKIHDELFLYPPIIQNVSSYECGESSKADGESRLVFIGGGRRQKIFLDYVIPAVSEIARERNEIITVFAVGVPDDLLPRSHDNVRFLSVASSTSYTLTLQRLINKDIDIVVHPGPLTVKGDLKTENILINAAILNAAVVTSDHLLFNGFPENTLRICAGSVSDWCNVLTKLMEDNEERKALASACKEYCATNYSGEVNRRVLFSIFCKHPYPGILLNGERVRQLLGQEVRLEQIPARRLLGAFKTKCRNRINSVRKNLLEKSRTIFRSDHS